MIGSDDVLACFIAGNTFTWEYVFSDQSTLAKLIVIGFAKRPKMIPFNQQSICS
jgi:hypothetical protein